MGRDKHSKHHPEYRKFFEVKEYGRSNTVWDHTVNKYGLKKAKQIFANNGDQSKAGKGNKGKKKSLEHRLRIAESMRGKKNALKGY